MCKKFDEKVMKNDENFYNLLLMKDELNCILMITKHIHHVYSNQLLNKKKLWECMKNERFLITPLNFQHLKPKQ